jgi:hypothetical protein
MSRAALTVDQRQRLRGQERRLVAPGVVGVRVRHERKLAPDERVQPQVVADD